jgi:glycosyltransferase involved in cell wall biosynthesis
MRKKILVKGPALSRSGYGEQTRFALRALRTREDLYDIYLMNIPWGHTGQISLGQERSWLDQRIIKTMGYIQQTDGKPNFDQSLQVTIPNEFEKIAAVDIGYTAGIETTKVAPEWIEKCNTIVDRVLVVSSHSKKVFENTKYTVKDQHGADVPNWGMQVPVIAINYPVIDVPAEDIEIELTTNNNFLVVSQWGPRKNLDNTIRWFVEEFKDDEDAGLVVKTNIAADCFTDREHTSGRLKALLSAYPDKKCKIYLVHGELTASQLKGLYTHDSMRALINIGHGEGFGLPLFEAAYNGLPLITITWSGQMDFICRPNKKGKNYPRIIKVDYDLNPVQKEALWNGVVVEGSMWAFAKEASYKRALRDAIEKNIHYKMEAAALQKYIVEKFTEEDMYQQFVEAAYGDLPSTVELEDIPKISLITSVYNAEEYIEGLMEDITSQTIFEEKCEWVILNVNPAGSDVEEEVIQRYVEKFPDNIVYERLAEDPGIYGTWNLAIEKSTGEFITNVNCDDRKSQVSLELHAKELVSNPNIDLVYADSLITDKPNETYVKNTSNGRKYNFPQFTLENLKLTNMPHNNPMWRRSYHEKYGVFDAKYRSAGDWELWLRGASQGAQFKKIDNTLGLYYFNPTGISTNIENNEWKQKEEKEVFEKYQ